MAIWDTVFEASTFGKARRSREELELEKKLGNLNVLKELSGDSLIETNDPSGIANTELFNQILQTGKIPEAVTVGAHGPATETGQTPYTRFPVSVKRPQKEVMQSEGDRLLSEAGTQAIYARAGITPDMMQAEPDKYPVQVKKRDADIFLETSKQEKPSRELITKSEFLNRRKKGESLAADNFQVIDDSSDAQSEEKASNIVTNIDKLSEIRKSMSGTERAAALVPGGVKVGKLGSPSLADWDVTKGLISQSLAKLVEKNRLSDADRKFYLSLISNPASSDKAFKAGMDSLKSSMVELLGAEDGKKPKQKKAPIEDDPLGIR